MGQFTETNLLAGISLVTEKYQSSEFRMPDTAALSSAYVGEKTNTSLTDLRNREDRATYYDFPVRKGQGSATERTALHTGDSPGSNRAQVTYKSVIDTFSLSKKQLDNNTISFEQAFANGVRSCIMNNLKDADDWYLAQLLLDKTQINVGGGRGEWDAINYDYKLTQSQKDYWKEQIEAVMSNNEYNTELLIIADSLAWADMTRSLNQGVGNSVNLGYQFGGGEIVKTSKQILNNFDGSAIAIPMDQTGLFQWIPRENRQPIDMRAAMSGEVGSFGSISVPVADDKGAVKYTIDAAMSMYAKRTDTSSLNGNKQDVLYQVELSWDMGYISAPLSSYRATGDFAGKTDSVVYTFGLSS